MIITNMEASKYMWPTQKQSDWKIQASHLGSTDFVCNENLGISIPGAYNDKDSKEINELSEYIPIIEFTL
jgi:hypothetical protein